MVVHVSVMIGVAYVDRGDLGADRTAGYLDCRQSHSVHLVQRVKSGLVARVLLAVL